MGAGLIASLAAVARNGFGSDITFDDAKRHILSEEMLHLFYDGKDEPVGFASYSVNSVDGAKVLYLGGVVVREDYQRRGFSMSSLARALKDTGADYLAMRTQNKVIYHIATRLGRTFPSMDAPDEEAVRIGEAIARKLGMNGYEPEDFLERGTYGKSLYGERQRAKSALADAVFRRLEIDPDRGDSILVITDLKDKASVRDAFREICRSEIPCA